MSRPTTETKRRGKILKLLQVGLTPKEIVNLLEIRIETVYNDIRVLKKKGGVLDEWIARKGELAKAKSAVREKAIQEKIEELEALNYQVSIPGGYLMGGLNSEICFDGDKIQYIGISDSHGGSKYEQFSILHAAYDYAERHGIKTVLHCGDIHDGYGLYRGHTFELFRHGATAQVRHVAEQQLPRKPGIRTYFIGGSHDHIFFKKLGLDAGAMLSAMRDDITFLGYNVGDVYFKRNGEPTGEPGLDKVHVKLLHPSGGCPYARSYRLQKIIEQLAPQNKPRVLMAGHLHITNLLPCYRNVVGIQMPCMQTQTPYLEAKGLYPEIGFVVVTLYVNDRDAESGLARINVDWRMQYEHYDRWDEETHQMVSGYFDLKD